MGIKAINLKCTVAAFLLLVMNSLPLAAQDDVKSLLEQLKDAEPVKAKQLDRAVQSEWSKSGSASMDLLLKRGRDAMDEQNYQAAIDHFSALTDHAPSFAEGWHMRATAFYQIDAYGLALADLDVALALNPDNYNAIFGLGVLLEELGYPERAYDAYQRVRAIHPHHSEVTKALQRLQDDVLGQSL